MLARQPSGFIMRVPLITAAAFLIYWHGAVANEPSHDFLWGEWINVEADGSAIECPDVLEFQFDGRYFVFNDCYGPNLKVSITESGKWSLEREQGELRLSSRKFLDSYLFMETKADLHLPLKVVDAATINLQRESYWESYRRLEK